MVTVHRFPDLATLIDAAARRFRDILAEIHSSPTGGVGGDGWARVVLTGGTAGIRLLERLREDPYAGDIDWSHVHVFFGDERNVEPSHPDSNEGQARAALLDHVGLAPDAVHGYGLTGGDMGPAVERYEEELSRHAANGFDVHLLGMGEEGHINSLFPHSAAVRERERLVLPVTDSPKSPAQRVTLTLPAVARARRVWLLVSGGKKAAAAEQVAGGVSDPENWPATGARGAAETALFYAG